MSKMIEKDLREEGKVELDILLTPKEVAAIFKVSPRTIERWLKEGKIKGIKIGAVWRIPKKAIKEILS